MVLQALGRRSEALDQQEGAYAQRSPSLVYFAALDSPGWRWELRDEPRHRAILVKMQFPQLAGADG